MTVAALALSTAESADAFEEHCAGEMLKSQLLRSQILARRTFVGFLVSGGDAVYFYFADEGLFAIASSRANTCIRTALTATRPGCRPSSRTRSSNSGTAVITRSISARCMPHRSACPAALTIALLSRTRTTNRATMAPTVTRGTKNTRRRPPKPDRHPLI